MGDFIFDDCQTFYLSRAGYDYTVPEWGPLEQYRDGCEAMPLVCGPKVFGLHANAEIRFFTDATKDLWVNLIELQPRTGGDAGGVSREDYVTEVAVGIQRKVPEPIDLVITRKEIGVPTPTQVVLLQELERWNALVSEMAETLKDLQKAITGEIGMSDALDALFER